MGWNRRCRRESLLRKAQLAIAVVAACALAALTPLQALAVGESAESAAEPTGQAQSVALSAQTPNAQDAKTYTVPVSVIKQGAENTQANLSMMRFCVYETAFVQPTDTGYDVTIYFRDATVMGVQVYASNFGEVKYDRGDGAMVVAESDVYDEATHTKAVTIPMSSLNDPVSIYAYMGTADFYFDVTQLVVGEAPTFDEVKQSESSFSSEWTSIIGGKGSDSACEAAVLSDGRIMVVGLTSSNDQDFKDRPSTAETAFVNTYTSDGELLDTELLEGAPRTHAYSVSAGEDDSYFVAGAYQLSGTSQPTDYFEGLSKVEEPGRDAWLAKYDDAGERQWIVGLSSSGTEQFQQVLATGDGGCIALAEVVLPSGGKSYDGEFVDELPGLVNAIAVKYDRDGKKQWHAVVGQASVNEPGAGLVELEGGGYVLAYEELYSAYNESGDFDHTYFVLKATAISAEGEVGDTRTYGSDADDTDACDYIGGAVATSDGGFAIFGHTTANTGTFADKNAVYADADEEYDDAFLIKCDASGDEQWHATLASSAASSAAALVETEDAYVLVGTTEGKDYDFEDLDRGMKDAFYASYDKKGARTSLRTFGGTSGDEASFAVVLDDNQIAVLVESNSNDGDMKGLNRGKQDGVLLATVDMSSLREAVSAAQEEREELEPYLEGNTGRATAYGTVYLSEMSYMALTASINTAQRLLEDPNASTSERDDAIAGLQAAASSAWAALEEAEAARAAQSELDDAIATAAAVKQGAKTDSAYKSLQAAIATARAAASDASRSSATMAAATTALRGAVSAFAKSADKAYLAKGKTFTVAGVTYKVTNASKRYVAAIKISTSKSALALGTVKYAGSGACKAASYKVTAVGAGAVKSARKLAKVTLGADVAAVGAKAFAKAPKLKTVVVKGRKLTKKGVTNSLRGSKVTRVKVSVGNAKLNKAYAKKYAKIFTKANAGKKVAVK